MATRPSPLQLILLAMSLVAGAVAVYHIRLGVPARDPWLFPMLVVFPALLCIGLAVGTQLSRNAQLNIATSIVAILLGLYAIDGLFELRPESAGSEEAVLPTGGNQQGKLTVVAQLRSTGMDAYPTIPADLLRAPPEQGGARVTRGGRTIIPLALLPNRTYVHCNESGRFSVFTTDEMGFNNPRGSWSSPVDVALVGDSFVEGACVDSAETLAATIRRALPHTLALGLDGAGPLSELGLIKEYLPAKHPAAVVWFYYEGNDLSDLTSEMRVPELRAYLRGAVQGLSADTTVLDSALIEEAKTLRPAVPAPAPPPPSVTARVSRWLRLNRLRHALALGGVAERLDACCDIADFRAVLAEAQRTVAGWGGQLYVVYLPAPGRLLRPASGVLTDQLRARRSVLVALRAQRLPVIDVLPAFAAVPDKSTLFYNINSHYSPIGYRIAGATVVRSLSAMRHE